MLVEEREEVGFVSSTLEFTKNGNKEFGGMKTMTNGGERGDGVMVEGDN